MSPKKDEVIKFLEWLHTSSLGVGKAWHWRLVLYCTCENRSRKLVCVFHLEDVHAVPLYELDSMEGSWARIFLRRDQPWRRYVQKYCPQRKKVWRLGNNLNTIRQHSNRLQLTMNYLVQIHISWVLVSRTVLKSKSSRTGSVLCVSC